ncbi:hypothetical protein [Halolamina salifodinae]|uniref:DUF3800 domain-containing protein n=1 Tax=Halolamina salifodinae TaxID=1202767 RepID=A0A8T4H2B2_9EURY|nr:hypothetical protein [Halolamina salifodinae]MBP1987954.1 hypothetical protein [Halolamina salifodinae]
MATLYVCVDESGRQDSGQCYTVAGCWFVSERRAIDTLDGTKDKLMETMFEGGPNELKGSKAGPDTLNTGVDYLRNVVYEDESIEQSSLPWSMSYPVGFSLVAFTPDTITETISDYIDRLDRPRVIQSFALNAVLKPLVHPEQVCLDGSISDVRVLLDSTTWDQPASDYARSCGEHQSRTRNA